MKRRIKVINCDGLFEKKLFKLIPFLLLLFFYPKLLLAQKKEHTHTTKSEVIFDGNHLSFDFSILRTSRARTKPITNNYPFSASPMPGIDIGISYRINFNTQHSLNTGIKATNAGRNFNLNINKDDFSPKLKQDYFLKGTNTLLTDLILSIPISFEKRLWNNERKFLLGQIGARINYSIGADFDLQAVIVENINEQFLNVAQINAVTNNNMKPWISYLLSAGHSWSLKNNCLFQISLESNISFIKYVNGTYAITFPGKPESAGGYSSTGTYIGITFSYVLTNANYRLRKLYEN